MKKLPWSSMTSGPVRNFFGFWPAWPETIVAITTHRIAEAKNLMCNVLSVRHPVHDVVHAELVGFVSLVHGPKAPSRPLPELGDVGVVVDDDLEPLAAIVVFVHTAEDRLSGIVGLRDDIEAVDFEERVKDRVSRTHLVEPHIRQHALHVLFEGFPAASAHAAAEPPRLEVVHDQKAALVQIVAKPGGL